MSPTAKPAEVAPNEAKQVEREPLADVIDAVRTDARKNPAEYARETIVPDGGE